jgi:RNA polymerase sigma factor (sigma-70 family)
MTLSDIEPRTVIQAQNGDAAARHRVLAAVAAWLPRAVALRYPADRGREDLCQEVLLQIHLGLDRVQQPEHFEAWAYGVLRNCTYARFRSDRRDRAEPTERVEELEPAPGAAPRPITPEELSGSAEAWRQGMDALAALGPKLREVYALYLEEHTISEIALQLELPRGTAASRLRTAQAMLRRRLGATEPDADDTKIHLFSHRRGG